MKQPFLNDEDFFKSVKMTESGELIKAKKLPVGTVSRGMKKVAEGKWEPVKKEKKKKSIEKQHEKETIASDRKEGKLKEKKESKEKEKKTRFKNGTVATYQGKKYKKNNGKWQIIKKKSLKEEEKLSRGTVEERKVALRRAAATKEFK